MDLLDLFRIMARRWWVVLPCVLVAAWIGLRAGENAAVEYSASATLQLTGPAQSDDEQDGSSLTSGTVVAELLQSAAVRQAVAGAGGTAPYRVEADGQLLRVIAQGEEPDVLAPTVSAVLAAVGGEVTRREDGLALPPTARTLVQTLREPGEPRPAEELAGDSSSSTEQTDEYVAVGSALLVSAQDAVPPNPVAASTSQAALFTEILSGQRSRAAVAAAGGVGGYELEADERQPLLRLRVTGGDESAVLRTVDAVLTVLNGELAARQAPAGVPEGLRVTAVPLVVPERATRDAGNASRTSLAIVALGALAAAALAVGVDRLFLGRRPRSGRGLVGTRPLPPQGPAQDTLDVRSGLFPAGSRGRRDS